MKCYNCKGTGALLYKDTNKMLNKMFYNMIVRNCSICNGTGRI